MGNNNSVSATAIIRDLVDYRDYLSYIRDEFSGHLNGNSNDYRQIKSSPSGYERGGLPYELPCGYLRLSLDVTSRYSDQKWLGEGPASRLTSSDGEWAVSYHGTSLANAKAIIREGFKESKQERWPQNKVTKGANIRDPKFDGVYSSPNIDYASSYTKPFYWNGNYYDIVIQCRVRPAAIVKDFDGKLVDGDRVLGRGREWLVSTGSDIRPYGILVRQRA